MSSSDVSTLSHGAGPTHGAAGHQCESCAAKAQAGAGSAPEQFVLAVGRVDVRFPSVGIEREFQQRERALGKGVADQRGKRLEAVLTRNAHLAQRVCYLFEVSNVPTYALVPTGQTVMRDLIDAVQRVSEPDVWVVVIGRRAVGQGLPSCGGILVPMLILDQIYCFSVSEWVSGLQQSLGALAEKHDIEAPARELWRRLTSSTENIGGLDTHRALNYVAIQHPGLALAVVERQGKSQLDRIEARVVPGVEGRRVVAIVFAFVSHQTGVTERLFCRVDVTEEWPFMADQPDGSRAPLALLPFVESGFYGGTW